MKVKCEQSHTVALTNQVFLELLLYLDPQF